MNLRFSIEDESGFAEARGKLLEGFEQWLRDERGLSRPDAVSIALEAGIALDWKWSYSDGDLGSWRGEDLLEFFFEWCPRKLSVPPDESAGIPSTVVSFLEFLSAGGMLAAGSNRIEQSGYRCKC